MWWLYLWQHWLGPFLRSNLFIVLSTFAAGYIAWRVYQSQKDDEKRNAANVLLLEIEGAEEGLRKVSPQNPFPDDGEVVLMRTASWDKYKHLFVADFINYRNEWDKISEFYTLCENYDEAVRFYRSARDDNRKELTANVQRVLAGYASTRADELDPEGDDFKNEKTREVLERRYLAKRQRFLDTATGSTNQFAHINHYIPRQFTDDAARALDAIDKNISTSTAGIKLRELSAQKKSLFRRLGTTLHR